MWICRKCSQPVFFAERKQSLGFDWHPNCLRCEECGKRLNPGQHAEHKGVPFCHHPCYGALFGPQLFGHGTRNECHTSFGRIENRDGQVKRSHLESHLKAYNSVYDGKPGELKSREVNGRLILEGVLRIYWGVKNIIHLKEEDDSRMIATRRKSCIERRVNNIFGSDSDEDDPLWRDDSPNRVMNRQTSNPADVNSSPGSTPVARLNGEVRNSQTNLKHDDNETVLLTPTDHEGNEVPNPCSELASTSFQHTNGHRDTDIGSKTDYENPGVIRNQAPGSKCGNQYPRTETSTQYQYPIYETGTISETSSEMNTGTLRPSSEINTGTLRPSSEINAATLRTSSEINSGTLCTSSEIKTGTSRPSFKADIGTQYPVSRTDTQYLSPVNNNQNRNQERLSKSGSTAIRRRRGRRMEKTKLKRRCSINGHFYLRETSSFTPPFGSPCSIWITSKTTAEEVLHMLLEKYKVEMSAFNFALFVVRDTGELRRVKEDESPLVTRVMLGPHEDVAKVFIMDAQRTHEVSHEVAQFLNLSLAECRAILVKYEQEETRYLEAIKRKYEELRVFIQNKINKCSTVELTFKE